MRLPRPGRRREQRLRALEELRSARRMLREDVTVFGEQLADLHLETLTDELDDVMRADYQAALDAYDGAKALLRDAAAVEADLAPVRVALTEGRYHLACVRARHDGAPLPARRDSCFFDPRHGPSVADVAWAPSGGVERLVPVCRHDELRLHDGERPDVRLVRSGDRYVPWWAAGEQQSLPHQRAQAMRAGIAYAVVAMAARTATCAYLD